MKKHHLPLVKNVDILFVLAYILLFIVLVCVYSLTAKNQGYYLKSVGFNPVKNTSEGSKQYLDHVPMEDMNFQTLNFDTGSYVGNSFFSPYIIEITLPKDLVYYQQTMGVKIPALTLKKGSKISFYIEPNSFVPYGYGYSTYPTYEQGWRYAVPFEVDKEPYQWNGDLGYALSQKEADFYYLRLSDLEVVARLLIQSQIESAGLEPFSEAELEQSIYNLVFYIDYRLLYNDIYFSPDIGGTLITKWDIFLLITSAGCFLLALILLFRSCRTSKSL